MSDHDTPPNVPTEEREPRAEESGLDQADVGAEGEPEAEGAVGLDDLESELQQTRDRLLRLQAEFDNYRKREARERSAAWARAKGDLVQKLLGAIDDLQRVADLDPEATSTGSVVEGVNLVERKLLDTLRREGLEPIGEPGEPFDPEIHDAIATAPAPSPDEEGRISAVGVKGYRFGNRLLRPAHVQVYERSESAEG